MANDGIDLTRTRWTDADFDEMGFHDVCIHTMAFAGGSLLLDVDFIAKWVYPEPPEKYFSFYIAPASLVFNGVFCIEISTGANSCEISIDGITREDAGTDVRVAGTDCRFRYTLDCQEVEISFFARGFELTLREVPVAVTSLELDPLRRRPFRYMDLLGPAVQPR